MRTGRRCSWPFAAESPTVDRTVTSRAETSRADAHRLFIRSMLHPFYTGPAMQQFFDSMVQLITQTATNLPPDVRAAMKRATAVETEGTRAAQALAIIADN